MARSVSKPAGNCRRFPMMWIEQAAAKWRMAFAALKVKTG
jgi:hypothetical protein